MVKELEFSDIKKSKTWTITFWMKGTGYLSKQFIGTSKNIIKNIGMRYIISNKCRDGKSHWIAITHKPFKTLLYIDGELVW